MLPAAAFGLVYFPLLSRVSPGLVSPYPKADLRTRIYAGAIDGMVLTSCWIASQQLDSLTFLVFGAVYLLLRDGIRGASLGKALCGLVVVNLQTGKPATLIASVQRNIVLLVPGANIAAAVLELITITRDPQGQRLGDRLAQTQVIDGFGARDLADAVLRWWQSVAAELRRSGRGRRIRVIRRHTERDETISLT